MTSSNLVIVRAGEESHHGAWQASNEETGITTCCNYDLLISYYGTDPDKYKTDGIERVDGVGGKLGDTFTLWKNRPDLFVGRKYVWLVDDDVEISSENVNKMFSVMEELGLHLAQPALSLDGFVNHRITAVHEGFKLRYTTMVETMIPCWSIELLKKVMPLFEGIRYGWGLDHIWGRFAGPKQSAILDCVPAKHCRPQGTGDLYVNDLDPIKEMKKNLKKFKLTQVPEPINTGAVLPDGSYIEGKSLENALRAPQEKILLSMLNRIKQTPTHTELLKKHLSLGH
jgi:hypothetical protein